MDRDDILRDLRAFEAAGLEYVLIGATAMGFHGVVRATEDLDLVIRATAENVERLRAALKSAYANDPQIDEFAADDLLGDYPTVRYYSPTGDLYFDVLTRLARPPASTRSRPRRKRLTARACRLQRPQRCIRVARSLQPEG